MGGKNGTAPDRETRHGQLCLLKLIVGGAASGKRRERQKKMQAIRKDQRERQGVSTEAVPARCQEAHERR